ncbi:phage tail sheath family protein, partial [Frankia sp. ACN1ag]|uniref:phage tail sheath family protein n=1 Tax=Frankia sp. ACN1ag TaxID=102891 RepID=UPI0037BE3EF8
MTLEVPAGSGDGRGSDGALLDLAAYTGSPPARTGFHLLDDVDLFNIVCVYGDSREESVRAEVYVAVLTYLREQRRRAFVIVDPPHAWARNTLLANPGTSFSDLGITGVDARNAAVFYPRILAPDPLRDGQVDAFPPSGAIAGLFARTDAERGVWKAPAGVNASIAGVSGLTDLLTDEENGALNQLGINCLRSFPVYGPVSWGARTLRGADLVGDEYKYIPVRRLALFVEESLYRGLKWVVFEPNDAPLWAQI